MQEQRGAELAFHVAAPDDLADIAVRRPVDQFGGQRKLAVIEHPDHDARAALFLGLLLYGKFHRNPPSSTLLFLAWKPDSRPLSANRGKSQKFPAVMIFRRSLFVS
jgi:hypothetical protein